MNNDFKSLCRIRYDYIISFVERLGSYAKFQNVYNFCFYELHLIFKKEIPSYLYSALYAIYPFKMC